MSTHFIAVPAAEGNIVAELGALLPANPSATASLFASMRQVGYAAWVLGLRDDTSGLECGCAAFLRTGRLNRTLEIPSLPAVGADNSFWDGLLEFCRHHGVTKLVLNTFGSPPGVEIPSLGTHCTWRSRCEFILDLSGDLAAMLNPKHKASVKRAEKAGVEVRRTRSIGALISHQALICQSMNRRHSRGENVRPIHSLRPSLEHVAFLESGAGELFQAVCGETVLSSALVLHAPKGSYYQSAGTSPEGMAVGASHFLIHSIASQLRADGAQIFNLGGANEDEQSSLVRFKKRFGASRVPLPSATCYIGPAWRGRISRAIELIRSDRKRLLRLLTGQGSHMIVYAHDTGTLRPQHSQVELAFRALTPEDLRGLSVANASFRARQLERLNRFGASYSYAVFANGQIAHVSWLLPPTAIEKDFPRVVRGRSGEAEITGCETLPEFRGRGIYGVAIRHLFEVAREQGVRRIFMQTTADNEASQAGIEKAGLTRVGSAMLIVLPVIQRLVVWRRF